MIFIIIWRLNKYNHNKYSHTNITKIVNIKLGIWGRNKLKIWGGNSQEHIQSRKSHSSSQWRNSSLIGSRTPTTCPILTLPSLSSKCIYHAPPSSTYPPSWFLGTIDSINTHKLWILAFYRKSLCQKFTTHTPTFGARFEFLHILPQTTA